MCVYIGFRQFIHIYDGWSWDHLDTLRVAHGLWNMYHKRPVPMSNKELDVGVVKGILLWLLLFFAVKWYIDWYITQEAYEVYRW